MSSKQESVPPSPLDKARVKAQKMYRHFYYFALYHHFHENYSVLYKFQTSNVRLLVADLNLYLSEASSSLPHLNVMLDELIFITNRDPVFKQAFLNCKRILIDLRKAQEEKNVEVIRRNIETLNRELNYQDKYLRKLQGTLSSFLVGGDDVFSPEYTDTDKHIGFFVDALNCYIAELQSKYSRKYIDYLRGAFLENSKDFDKAYGIFTKLLFEGDYVYEVQFSLRIYKDFNSEMQAGGFDSFVAFLKASQICPTLIGQDDASKTFSIVIKQSGSVNDTFIISKSAKIKLSTVINSFLFEYNTFRIDILREVEVKRVDNNKEQRPHKLQMERPEYHVHLKKDLIIKKLMNLGEEQSMVDEDTLFRIENSLRYYSSFLHETEEDKKLLNLWIALENLFRNLEGEQNTFNTIKSVLGNLLILFHVRDHCDEFQVFLQEREKFLKEKGKPESLKYLDAINHFKDNNNGHFNSVGLLKVLSNIKLSEKVFESLESVGNNYYNVYKYKELTRKLRRSKTGKYATLYDSLHGSGREFSWEIARIYRKRNQIVHGHKLGDLKVNLRDLVMLEHFYHLIIESLIDFLSSENYKTYSIVEFISKVERSKVEYLEMVKHETDIKDEYLVIPRIAV